MKLIIIRISRGVGKGSLKKSLREGSYGYFLEHKENVNVKKMACTDICSKFSWHSWLLYVQVMAWGDSSAVLHCTFVLCTNLFY